MNFCTSCDSKLDDIDLELSKRIYGVDKKLCKDCLRKALQNRKDSIPRPPVNNLREYIIFYALPQIAILIAVTCIIINAVVLKEAVPFLFYNLLLSGGFSIFGLLIDVAIMGGAFAYGIIGAIALWKGKFLKDSSRVVGYHYEASEDFFGNVKVEKKEDYEGGGEWFVNVLMVLVAFVAIACGGVLICIIKQKRDNRMRAKLKPTYDETSNFFQKIKQNSIPMYNYKLFSDIIYEYRVKCRRRDFNKEEMEKVEISLPAVKFQGKSLYLVAINKHYYIYCNKYSKDGLKFYVGYEMLNSAICIAENISRSELGEYTKYLGDYGKLGCYTELVTDRQYDLEQIIKKQY